MKLTLIILVLQVGSLFTYGQGTTEYTFVIKGLIGITDVVPIESAVVELNDIVEITDHAGKVSITTSAGSIRVEVRHISYIGIDTTFDTQSLDTLTELFIWSECTVNKDLAQSDIDQGEIRLLLAGGIAPTHIIGQENMEKRYGFVYDDYGCTTPGDGCMMQYNFEIFRYLDEKYGKSWRKRVRQDVVGLKEYRKKYK